MDEMQRDFYTKSEVNNKFGGMVLLKISKADFDELETKDPNTIYYVFDDSGNVTQYVGDAELSGGGGLTGAPILIVNRALFGNNPLCGTPIIVEE